MSGSGGFSVSQPLRTAYRTMSTRLRMGYLRDEMLLVQAGKADGLTVLDDEIAYTESLALRQ